MNLYVNENEMPKSCADCPYCPNWHDYENVKDYVRNRCVLGAGHNCNNEHRHLKCPLKALPKPQMCGYPLDLLEFTQRLISEGITVEMLSDYHKTTGRIVEIVRKQQEMIVRKALDNFLKGDKA